jgi:membrane protease YdiL (CAAX protease family)
LITWGIWSLWHYPAILFADYNSSLPIWLCLLNLTLSILGMSVLTAWLRLKTGSIWPSVLWHGAHNAFIQGVFLNMTIDGPFTDYLVDDFGFGVLVSSLVFGIIFWRKRYELVAG